ncbi:MAG: ATP-binding cassette domain-containing protein [Thermomicrobiales bacterium]
MSEPLIEVEDISYAYVAPGAPPRPALVDVSLRLPAGQLVALVGQNGSGKSTLARHLNGLLKPDAGRVTVTGIDTRTEAVGRLAARVGYVFQNPDHQLFLPTVRAEVEWGPRQLGLEGAALAGRVEETLGRFGLDTISGRHPASLGRGLRRLTALAAVMAMNPRALVLDEPTGGLDHRRTEELMAMLRGLVGEGRLVILITHEMPLVAAHADRMVVLRQGRIVGDDTPQALFDQPELLATTSLDPPEAARLAQALRPLGMPARVATPDAFVAACAELLAGRR